MTIGQLYEKNGQTEFPSYAPTRGNAGVKMNVVRYRWTANGWMAEVVEAERIVAGGGK